MSAGKRKGTAWESAIVTYLRQWFPWADRVPLSGARDRGDVTISPGSPVIEAKNAARVCLAEWVDEANAEAVNAGVPWGVVWVKRRGKSSPAHGYVVMSGSTYVALLLGAGWGAEEAAS